MATQKGAAAKTGPRQTKGAPRKGASTGTNASTGTGAGTNAGTSGKAKGRGKK